MTQIFPTHRVGIRTCSDYSPFGVELDGRTVSGGGNRFGYNGHEIDDEISGDGNHLSWQDYGMNPRMGRRWGSDPQAHNLPYQSTYSVNNNNPISIYDPDGEFGILGAIIGAVSASVIDAGSQVYKGMKEGKGFGDAFLDINLREVGAAALGGAVMASGMGFSAPLVASMGGAGFIGQTGVAYLYGGTAILSTLAGSLVKNAFKGRGEIDGQEVLYDVTYAIPDLLTGGLIDNIGGTILKKANKEAQQTINQAKNTLKKGITKDLILHGTKRSQAKTLAKNSIKKMGNMIDKGSFPKTINIKIGTGVSKVVVNGIGAIKKEEIKKEEIKE